MGLVAATSTNTLPIHARGGSGGPWARSAVARPGRFHGCLGRTQFAPLHSQASTTRPSGPTWGAKASKSGAVGSANFRQAAGLRASSGNITWPTATSSRRILQLINITNTNIAITNITNKSTNNSTNNNTYSYKKSNQQSQHHQQHQHQNNHY